MMANFAKPRLRSLRKTSPGENCAALRRLMPAWRLFLAIPSLLVAGACSALAQTATLALTPPMGWSTWNHYQHDISDALVRAQADAMVASGMREAGYVYVNIDGC